MDFTLDQDQQAISEAVETILSRRAGPTRAREIGADGHDDLLLGTLAEEGFLDMALDATAGPLPAALAVMAGARAHARINLGVRALVAPMTLGAAAPLRVAITTADRRGPVRYGQFADVVIVVDGDDAVVAPVDSAVSVATQFGFPYADITTSAARALPRGSGEVATRWWRLALAAEMSGALRGAIDHTVAYLAQRRQFGKPLGSLQAIQHRLAEAHITAEGAAWLTRRAAWHGAPAEEAAQAAAYSAWTAGIVAADLHQLSGAIGFTSEFDLHLWTTRLQGLRLEMGGKVAHQIATATARWG